MASRFVMGIGFLPSPWLTLASARHYRRCRHGHNPAARGFIAGFERTRTPTGFASKSGSFGT